MTLVVQYNPLPGKTAECDGWVRERLVPYFLAQPECKGVRVLEDILIGDPERTCVVEFSNVCAASSILESQEAKDLKEEFMHYATDFSSQVLRTQVHRPRAESRAVAAGEGRRLEKAGDASLDVYIGT